MAGFSRRHGRLYLEDIALGEIAERYGTPCYVYSQNMLTEAVTHLRDSFPQSLPRFFYAVKANGNLSVLRLMRQAGCGFDIVSQGEMARGLAAGGRGEDMVFSGVGKSADDISAALQANIGCFNAESADEVARLEALAKTMNRRAPLALRVTPDIDGGTHPYLATGIKEGKFGIPPHEALALAQHAAAAAHLNFLGFAYHIGSQIREVAAYVTAAKQMSDLVAAARTAGLQVAHIDMGGGFAVDYKNSCGLDISLATYDAELARCFKDIPLWLEPGRSIVAAAGVLLTRVEYIKQAGSRMYWIVDAGMNDILRPMLYGAHHNVETVADNGAPPQTGDIAGPVCESTDILARAQTLSASGGDVLAVRDAGAYCAAMMSAYNTRPRPCEVLVHNGQSSLIRRREKIGDMLADEKSLL